MYRIRSLAGLGVLLAVSVTWSLGVGFGESAVFSLDNLTASRARHAVVRTASAKVTSAVRVTGSAVRVTFRVPAAQNVTVSLFSLNGRQVRADHITAVPGDNVLLWDLRAIRANVGSANGMYVVHIRHANGAKAHQVMILAQGGAR